MPRPRNPKRKEAHEMWLDSGKEMRLKDIAAALEVSESQVRNWKQQDNWENVAQCNTQDSHETPNRGAAPLKKAGAPKGNKNAVGHGAPKGNKNAMKHGAFERFAFEYMTEDEIEIAQDTALGSVEEELRTTLAFLKARELRLIKRIAAIRNLAGQGRPIDSVTHTFSEKKTGTFSKDEDGMLIKDKGTGFFDGEMLDMTVTNSTSIEDALNRLENELDKVQSKKIKLLAQLDKMQIDRERLELERLRAAGESEQSKLANEWVEALLSLEDEEENIGDE